MWGWIRQPVVHFVFLGGTLFVLDRTLLAAPPQDASAARAPIVFSPERVEEIRADYTQQSGLAASAADEVALIRQALDDELLYREAAALGLDRHDRSVRWRLIQKMQFVSEDAADADHDEMYQQALALGLDRDDIVIRRILTQKMRLLASLPRAGEEPTDDELQAFFDAHRADYLQPARVSFTHVFLSSDRRGDSLADDAEAVRDQLRREQPRDGQAIALGDHFPLNHRFQRSSERHLAKLFGPEFASAVMAVEGDDWSDAIGSAYGLHLVQVTGREAPADPPFDTVRRQVLQRVRAERRDERLARVLLELREKFVVQIESEAWRERDRS